MRGATAPWVARAVMACAILSFEPGNVRSNPGDTFGVGGRGSALGDAVTALIDLPEATFSNPGSLGYLERTEFSFGPMWSGNGLWLKDIDRERSYVDYSDVSGYYMGVGGPLGRLFSLDGLGVGVLIFLPKGGFTQVDIPQRAFERTFFKYRDRNKRIFIDAALSYRILDWLSVGIGADLLLNLWAQTDVDLSYEKYASLLGDTGGADNPDYFPADSQEGIDLYIRRNTKMRAALVAGLTLRPLSWLSVGICYRGEQKVHSAGGNSFSLELFPDEPHQTLLDDAFHVTGFFVPMQVSLGVAVKPLVPLWQHDRLLVSMDVVWENWSAYLDHRSRTPMENIEGVAFQDVWSYRLGIEWSPWRPLWLRAGLRYEPTPAPLPIGEENLLDSDSLTITAGFGFDLEELFRDGSVPVAFNFFFRWHQLDDIDVQKDEAYVPEDQIPPDGQRWVDIDPQNNKFPYYNPGYPTYEAGGHIWSVGLSITYRFGLPGAKVAP